MRPIEPGTRLDPETNYAVFRVFGPEAIPVGPEQEMMKVRAGNFPTDNPGTTMQAILGNSVTDLKLGATGLNSSVEFGEYSVFEITPGTYVFLAFISTLRKNPRIDLRLDPVSDSIFSVSGEKMITYIGDLVWSSAEENEFGQAGGLEMVVLDNRDELMSFLQQSFGIPASEVDVSLFAPAPVKLEETITETIYYYR